MPAEKTASPEGFCSILCSSMTARAEGGEYPLAILDLNAPTTSPTVGATLVVALSTGLVPYTVLNPATVFIGSTLVTTSRAGTRPAPTVALVFGFDAVTSGQCMGWR